MGDLFVARDPLRVAARLRRAPRHGGTAWRALVSVVMLLVSLAALGMLTMVREEIAAQVTSPMAAKLRAADRVLYYEFGEGHGPVFRLAPADRSLKLITHLVLPPGTKYDEEAEFRYGVVLRLTDLEGELQWTQVIDIGTRQSKGGGTARGWLLENSFLVGEDRELSDDRLTRIRLPPAPSEDDRLLELRLEPLTPRSHVSGLVRVYAKRPRKTDERSLRELSLAPEQRRELVDDLTYHDWDQLSDAERNSKLRWVWDRIAALGEPNLDYWTKSVYETGFRLPRESFEQTRWQRVDPLRSLAFNVMGPADIELRTQAVAVDCQSSARSLEFDPLGGGCNESLGTARLELHWLNVAGEDAPLLAGLAEPRKSLWVPPGVQTIFVSSDRPLDVDLRVLEHPPNPVRFSNRPQRIGEDGNEYLEPDYRRVPQVFLHPPLPGTTSTTLRADGRPYAHERPAGARYRVSLATALEDQPVLGEAASRMLRFDVRYTAKIAMTWPARPPVPELELCFLDDAGQEVAPCEPWRGRPPQRSEFEARRVGDPSSGAKEELCLVSEPQTLRAIVPEGAALVEVRTAQQLLVRGYGYWPEVETTLAEPWKAATSEQTRWRYVVLDERTWFPILPINHDALEEHAMTADLIAQIRLMPVGRGGGSSDPAWWAGPRERERERREPYIVSDAGWDPGPWVTVDPLGRHLRRSLLEELDPEAPTRLRERWDASLFTELLLGRRFVVDLSAAGPAAPELHWQTTPDMLGRRLVVELDDRVESYELTSTRGRVRLPVESGRASLRVTVEGQGRARLDAWIDRPVLVASPPVSRRRVVHELTSRSLVIPFVKPSDDALILNVVMYVPEMSEDLEIDVLVDEGQPQRREGLALERISRAELHFELGSLELIDADDGELVDLRRRIRFVDLEGPHGVPLDVVTFPVVLGEDIAPGEHRVRVDLDESRVWIRAFHRGVGDTSKPATARIESSMEGDW